MTEERANEGARNSQGRAEGKSIAVTRARLSGRRYVFVDCMRTRMAALSEMVIFLYEG